jgi:hypothetical protein
MVVAEFLLEILQSRCRTTGNGTFQSPKETKHTHEGNYNLCLAEIKGKMKLTKKTAYYKK